MKVILKKTKHVALPVIILLVVSLAFTNIRTKAEESWRRLKIELTGVASGGILTFSILVGNAAEFVSITTTNGEPSWTVVSRLVDAARTRSPDFPNIELDSTNNSVFYVGGNGCHMFAGNEAGLGIPAPPTSLSLKSFDPTTGSVCLCWENPPSGYDEALIIVNGESYSDVPRNATTFSTTNLHPSIGFDLVTPSFAVIGITGFRRSNAAVINVNGLVQEEITCIPFYAGVMPNWRGWSNVVGQSTVRFEQGSKPNVSSDATPTTADEKPFYQKVSGLGTFKAGIWRKFLGLTPGATYELSVRVNTLAIDSVSNWTYSVHATHNGMNDVTLTVAQLSGEAALPDGSSGMTAGQIVKYQAGGPTTKGMWAKQGTSTAGPGRIIGNITLPSGVTSITIWTRHTCTNSTSTGVGIDWVALKKLD